MIDYYKKKKKEAVAKMEILRGVPHIENTWEGMRVVCASVTSEVAA